MVAVVLPQQRCDFVGRAKDFLQKVLSNWLVRLLFYALAGLHLFVTLIFVGYTLGTSLSDYVLQPHELSYNMKKDTHPVAQLNCADHGGPLDPQEMVYWSDIPGDSSYVSPLAPPRVKLYRESKSLG